MSKWRDLPNHLLQLIAEKNDDFEIVLVLGLICKPWKAVAEVCKQSLMKKTTRQLPWLMLPPKKGCPLRGFYSLSSRRIHQIPSWESNGKKCYSSGGWLLTVGSDWGMNLLHPFTLARFKLPGIKSFDKSRHEGFVKPYVRFIQRALLSVSPSLTSNFLLMVIQGCPGIPAYWRPGDKRWTLIESTSKYFADAVFFQDKCYFITYWGELLVTDFGTPNPTTAEFITQVPGGFFQVVYLVILEGSLLLVSRKEKEYFHKGKEFRSKPYKTVNFQVLKLNFKTLSWEEVKSFGNWSIFLGNNSSMALNATEVEECKPNSIYFTDDCFDFCHSTREGAGFDMGIFNMADKTIEPIIEGVWRNRVSPPIFVQPTF